MSASLVCSRVGSFLSTYVIFLVSTRNKRKRIHKLTSVFHACVCLVIDREFRYNIVKVAVNRRGDGPAVNPQTTSAMLLRNSLSI